LHPDAGRAPAVDAGARIGLSHASCAPATGLHVEDVCVSADVCEPGMRSNVEVLRTDVDDPGVVACCQDLLCARHGRRDGTGKGSSYCRQQAPPTSRYVGLDRHRGVSLSPADARTLWAGVSGVVRMIRGASIVAV